jgi:hypothetical protein
MTYLSRFGPTNNKFLYSFLFFTEGNGTKNHRFATVPLMCDCPTSIAIRGMQRFKHNAFLVFTNVI